MIHRSTFSKDILASLVLFLISIPLCLGVALASGAPLFSGLIAGIIGGVVVGIYSDSHVSVSGPCTALMMVIPGLLVQLGSFESLLLATLLAGGMQLIIGYAKGGFVANFIPGNVVQGLLTSLGFVLMLKQIPHAFGIEQTPVSDFSFSQPDGENTFSELLHLLPRFSVGSLLIALVSLLIMLSWSRLGLSKKIRFIPSALVVVVVSILLNCFFEYALPSIVLGKEGLVSLPPYIQFMDIFRFPDFSQITNYHVWWAAVTIAAIASLETLVSLEALEWVDPHKRIASPNVEMIAQGIGNTLSGLIGGIPISSTIIRGTVNVDSGAQSKLSTIFHGFLLVLSFILLAPFINLIPLSAIAAILIVIGYKLFHPTIFRTLYLRGMEHFIPFLTTVVAIVFTDLLTGTLIGLAVSLLFAIKSNYQYPFLLNKGVALNKDEVVRIELPSQVSFFNKATLKDTLRKIEPDTKVIIDARYCNYMHVDIIDLIQDFRDTIATEKNIKLNIIGLQEKYTLKDTIQFVNVLDKEAQEKMSFEDILHLLKEGNERFVSGKPTEKYLSLQVQATSKSQHPFAAILSCMDSRATVEHIFDLGVGSIFSLRIAGNVVNEDILGSLEYATQAVGAKLVVVMGHTKCGAIKGACEKVELGNLTPLLKKVRPAIHKAARQTKQRGEEFLNLVAKQNVIYTVEQILKGSKTIARLEKEGKVKIVGAMYDVETGIAHFL